MKKFLSGLLSAVLIMQCAVFANVSAENVFGDLNGHWAQGAIEKMAGIGIAKGRADGVFAPEDSITRAEYLTLACRITGTAEAPYADAFSDITGTEWYAGYVQAGKNAGLIPSGMVADGSFHGDTLITREEIAAISVGAKSKLNGETLEINPVADEASEALSSYIDADDISDWAKAYVAKAVNDGIVNGMTETEIAPKNNATRAQAIVMLSRISPFYDAENLMSAPYPDLTIWEYDIRHGLVENGYPIATPYHSETEGHTPDDGCIVYDVEWSGKGNVINAYTMSYIFRNPNGAIIAGEKYKVGFMAKLEGVDSLKCNAVKLCDIANHKIQYSEKGSTTISGEGWKEYTFELTATDTLPEVKLIFQMGGDDKSNYKVYFDSFYMIPQGVKKDIAVKASTDIASITGEGAYEITDTPLLTATSPDGSGIILDYWEDHYGNKVSPNSEYTALANSKATYTAHFGSYSYSDGGFTVPVSEKLSATVSAPFVSGRAVSTTGKITAPKGFTVMESGAIFYPGIWTENFNLFSNGISKTKASAVEADGSFTVAANMETKYGVLTKAYAIAKSPEGQVFVIYSDDSYTKPANAPEKREYNTLFYHELHGIFTDEVENNPESHGKYVDEIALTGADIMTVTPSTYKFNLWPSKVDPYWTTEAEYSQVKSSQYVEDARQYILNGGDPVQDTLDAAKRNNIAMFIDQRMNDSHNNGDKDFPTHSTFWKSHPEYWLKDSSGNDNDRNMNYMEPEVREYFYNLMEELMTNYDVDGLQMDFQRHVGYFHSYEKAMGNAVMTEFVGRVSEMVNRLSIDRGKDLQLSVRIPGSGISECNTNALDVTAWNKKQYIDIMNVGNHYYNILSIGIEEFKEIANGAKVFGEMHFLTFENPSSKSDRRFVTPEVMYATANNFYSRGADGISFFNMQYIPRDKRLEFYPQLPVIDDGQDVLASLQKKNMITLSFDARIPRADDLDFDVCLVEDTENFLTATIRVEFTADGTQTETSVTFNGTGLKQIERDDTEFFTTYSTGTAYPTAEKVKFFDIPLDLIKKGDNHINIKAPGLTMDGVQIAFHN